MSFGPVRVLKYLPKVLLSQSDTANACFGQLAVQSSIAIINVDVVVGFPTKLSIQSFALCGVETKKPSPSITDRLHYSIIHFSLHGGILTQNQLFVNNFCGNFFDIPIFDNKLRKWHLNQCFYNIFNVSGVLILLFNLIKHIFLEW